MHLATSLLQSGEVAEVLPGLVAGEHGAASPPGGAGPGPGLRRPAVAAPPHPAWHAQRPRKPRTRRRLSGQHARYQEPWRTKIIYAGDNKLTALFADSGLRPSVAVLATPEPSPARCSPHRRRSWPPPDQREPTWVCMGWIHRPMHTHAAVRAAVRQEKVQDSGGRSSRSPTAAMPAAMERSPMLPKPMTSWAGRCAPVERNVLIP